MTPAPYRYPGQPYPTPAAGRYWISLPPPCSLLSASRYPRRVPLLPHECPAWLYGQSRIHFIGFTQQAAKQINHMGGLLDELSPEPSCCLHQATCGMSPSSSQAPSRSSGLPGSAALMVCIRITEMIPGGRNQTGLLHLMQNLPWRIKVSTQRLLNQKRNALCTSCNSISPCANGGTQM